MTVIRKTGEATTPTKAYCFPELPELFEPPEWDLVAPVAVNIYVKRLSEQMFALEGTRSPNPE